MGTVQAGEDGSWRFQPTGPGVHSFIASEIDAAGNTGAAPSLVLTAANPRFAIADATSGGQSGSVAGSDYTGPLDYLTAQLLYSGSNNIILVAQVPSVFLHTGSGDDALAVSGGSNVLDGGTGSNWLVGASGLDGGDDTFFSDRGGSQNTWDTVIDFHPGDMFTLWGFDSAAGSINWSADQEGASGYQGSTLQAMFGNASGGTALITFAGTSADSAFFATSTGTTGGLDYLMITRTA